ncbi:hypothetical protein DXU84_23655, partial [Rahnella sp. RcJ3]|nr:hypothetical protein [Rahnella sp. RcJ3]
SMMSMNPFYTSHRIGQLILKRSALRLGVLFCCAQKEITQYRAGLRTARYRYYRHKDGRRRRR